MENIVLSESVEMVSSLETECPEGLDPLLWDSWKHWQDLGQDDFRYQVKQGLQGKNIGLGNGLTAINRYIYGTHKARYYLIGADSGVGKTTISDFMYILQAWEEAKRLGRNFKCFYFSFELSKTSKVARWVSYYVFVKYGIRLPSDYILGRVEGKLLTKEHEKLVMLAHQQVLELLKCVHIMDHMIHPTLVFESLATEYEKLGTVTREKVSEEDARKGKKGFIKGYKANDPDMIVMAYLDHMALTHSEKGLDTKGTMDKLSKYFVVLRNLFDTTVVAIQQFSTDMLAANRTMFTKKSEATIRPTRLDFGDSKATYRDADVVLAYIKPGQDLSSFYGYNLSPIDGLGGCMVAQYILKNRYGPADRMLPLFLDGATGFVYDLPDPNNPILMLDWYDKAQQIEQLCKEFCPTKN